MKNLKIGKKLLITFGTIIVLYLITVVVSQLSMNTLGNNFEKFYKVTDSDSNSFGIGLALSKSIIEKQNGYISVDSKIGEGTTFIIKYLK